MVFDFVYVFQKVAICVWYVCVGGVFSFCNFVL
jgi:hypothetical protein